jgi:hypothetical protein
MDWDNPNRPVAWLLMLAPKAYTELAEANSIAL